MWPEKQALFMRNRAFNYAFLRGDCRLVNSDGEMACAAGRTASDSGGGGEVWRGCVDAKKDPAGRQALRPGQACVWLSVNGSDRGEQLDGICLGLGVGFRLGSSLGVGFQLGGGQLFGAR